MAKWFFRGTCFAKVFLLLFFSLKQFYLIFITKKMFYNVVHTSHQVRHYNFFIVEVNLIDEFDTDVKIK